MHAQDRARALLRRMLNRRLYHIGATLLNLAQVLRTQGLRTSIHLFRHGGSPGRHERLSLRGLEHDIYFRPGTSDRNTLIQSIIREEYGQLAWEEPPRYIIDGGAYIGDVALYFLNRFPGCEVIALEPNPENARVAQMNLDPYGDRVELLTKGLWSEQTQLCVRGKFTASVLRSATDSGVTVECTDISTILRRRGWSKLDVVKLDIEGAERQVLLSNSEEWLKLTQCIIAELHGADITRICTTFLEQHGFRWFRYRSVHYFRRTA